MRLAAARCSSSASRPLPSPPEMAAITAACRVRSSSCKKCGVTNRPLQFPGDEWMQLLSRPVGAGPGADQAANSQVGALPCISRAAG